MATTKIYLKLSFSFAYWISHVNFCYMPKADSMKLKLRNELAYAQYKVYDL